MHAKIFGIIFAIERYDRGKIDISNNKNPRYIRGNYESVTLLKNVPT